MCREKLLGEGFFFFHRLLSGVGITPLKAVLLRCKVNVMFLSYFKA